MNRGMMTLRNILLVASIVCVLLLTAFLPSDASAVIFGVNNHHIWSDSQAYTALDAIKNNGFNTVRIVWATTGSGSRLKQIIDRCKALGLQPIPELHDDGITGGINPSQIDCLVTYLINNKSYIDSDVWINIANEWGPANSTVWRDAYINGIQRMRDAGMSHKVVIDSGGHGQDDRDILNYGPAIMSAQPNVIFSIHMYGSWNDNNKINNFLTTCQTRGIPIMVGEFGYNYNNGSNNLSCKVDAVYLMNTCKSKGIGYIGWSWCGNNAENAWLDMTSNWSTLTAWGSLIKDSEGGTGVIPEPGNVIPVIGNWYKLVNRNSGKAIDVTGESINKGTGIIQWPYHDGYNQQWGFQNP